MKNELSFYKLFTNMLFSAVHGLAREKFVPINMG